MIAQILLSLLLLPRPALRLDRIPPLARRWRCWRLLAAAGRALFRLVALAQHAVAELVGIGRGVDLILYIWVCISLIVLLNLHLKLRTQTELITKLARTIALANVLDARARH